MNSSIYVHSFNFQTGKFHWLHAWNVLFGSIACNYTHSTSSYSVLIEIVHHLVIYLCFFLHNKFSTNFSNVFRTVRSERCAYCTNQMTMLSICVLQVFWRYVYRPKFERQIDSHRKTFHLTYLKFSFSRPLSLACSRPLSLSLSFEHQKMYKHIK